MRPLVLLLSLVLLAGCVQQAAQGPPPPPPKPPLEFLGEWGTPGDGPGQLSHPTGIATDALGNVYICDSASGFVHKFDRQGGPLLSFQDLYLKEPSAIAVDYGGAIYASGRGLVLLFLPNGDRLRILRGIAGQPFKEADSLVVDQEGNVLVTETAARRVVLVRAERRRAELWLHASSEAGGFGRLGPAARSSDGTFYVADLDGQRIWKAAPDGTVIGSWPLEASSVVTGLAASEKYVFAVVNGQGLVVWTPDGLLLRKEDISARIAAAGEPAPPVRLALGWQGELLVLDTLHARVLRFRVNF